MKNIKCFLLVTIIFLTGSAAKAQDKSPEEVKKLVESQNYIFRAEMVYPQNGRSRMLTSEYDLTITNDTIFSYLPYFGRSYSAPADPTGGGIKFTSTDFDYTSKKKKKTWEITIKPKDAPDVQEMYLSIFDNGTANLSITNTNRQNISFNGYIKEGKEIEKKAF